MVRAMKKVLLILALMFRTLWATPSGPVADVLPDDVPLSGGQAVTLGIIEGLTEFLPVSSTGHLVLAERVMQVATDPASEQALDTYMIVIQLGAILAVAWVYHAHLLRMLLGLAGRDAEGRTLLRNLLIPFMPAALIGILFVDLIKGSLFNLWVVAFAWFAGGIALILWGKKEKQGQDTSTSTLADLSIKQALLIGALQVLAMLPGTSRSLVTILGGKWAGLSLQDSVVFSFLLGLITLSASTLYDMALNGQQMIDLLGIDSLVIGLLTAAVSAWLAVRGMVHYLRKHGMALFGFYRIALAGLTAALLLTGVLTA
jgi:undecaprenyl-diphosphatase